MVWKIRAILKKEKPDFIHAFFITDCGFLAALSGFHPLIIRAMGSDVLLHPARNILYRIAYKYAIAHADIIHTDTNYVRQVICDDGALKNKVIKVAGGVNVDIFKPQPRNDLLLDKLNLEADNKIIISTRGLEPVYDVQTLIRAIPNIIDKHNNVRVIIAGIGSTETSLKDLAESLKVTKFIRFVGYVKPEPNMASLLNMATLYVSTSLSDTFATSTLEAFACGKPVIVSDVPGTEEAVKNGINGYIFRRGDHVMLTNHILNMLDHPEIIEQMGRENREYAESNFDISKQMALIGSFYTSITHTS